MAAPSEGDKAPEIDLETDDGGRFRLRTLRGRKVVVYFYPKDDTQGCTIEAIDFSKAAAAFAKAGIAVVGISPDTVKSHCKFRDKHALAVPLAADPERKAIGAYGVWVAKSMYGRKYMGVERATFLIGPDGRIGRVWRKVKVPGHVAEVLAAAGSI